MANPERHEERHESEVLAQVRRYLRARGIFHLRQQSGAQRKVYKGRERWVQFGARGMADLLAFPQIGRTPFPVWIETKSPSGRLSRDQLLFRRAVMQQGHAYVIVREAASIHDALGGFEGINDAKMLAEQERAMLADEDLELRSG